MGSNGDNRLSQLFEMATLLGESWGVQKAQSMLIPHVLRLFAEYNHRDVKRMVVTDYPLVQKHLPPKVETAFRKLNKNPRTREQYHEMMVRWVTPENVLAWMDDPDEWLPDEEAAEQREALQRTAAILREMPDGEEWLSQQIWELYRIAGVAPEDSTRVAANE